MTSLETLSRLDRGIDQTSELANALDLADYRRRVFELYALVRATELRLAWEIWRAERDELFAHHPQSALDVHDRLGFTGLTYHDYDPAWRYEAMVEPAVGSDGPVGLSGGGATRFETIGVVHLELPTGLVSLALYSLDAYGGGLFLPFRDATAGTSTYGGGRYLLDTVKGADLGGRGGSVVLDFNFAYHPSCVYSPRWSCPLAPPENRLPMAVTAGERLPATGANVASGDSTPSRPVDDVSGFSSSGRRT